MLDQKFNRTLRKRRAIVIGYYLAVAFAGVFFGHALDHHTAAVAPLIPALYVVSVALGGVKSGGPIRPFSRFYRTSARPSPVDERDARVRDRAHYAAFSLMRAAGLLFTLLLVAVFVLDRQWLVPLMAFLLYPAYALVMSLPQAILLWTEPDMAPDPDHPDPAAAFRAVQ